MRQLDVAASTFPYLYSHNGLDALRHLRSLGYDKFEMMIFPPHCGPGNSGRETQGIQGLAR